MSHFFLDRFKGAWLGSILPLLLKPQSARQVMVYTQTTRERKIVEQLQQQSELLLNYQQNQNQPLIIGEFPSDMSVAELLRQLVPAIVYFHDDWSRLRTILSNQSGLLNVTSEDKNAILIWSYILCLALRKEINCSRVLDLAIAKVGLKPSEVEWCQDLKLAYSQGSTFTELESRLSDKQQNREIPLALFCFLSNLNNFSLTVSQALVVTNSVEVAALTGTLAGAYNGWRGVPVVWRNQVVRYNFFPWLEKYTTKLMKQWLGAEYEYPEGNDDPFVPGNFIITAPRIAQPRADLKIVSQAEYRHE